jgi:hypothetical protein
MTTAIPDVRLVAEGIAVTPAAETVKRADRASNTIRRLFERHQISANVATARLLMVDLAAGRHAARPKRRAGRARPALARGTDP